jgi:thymidylate synthase (FAD)
MNVKILDHTQNPIETIYKAYRICYSKDVPTEINTPDYDKMVEFIKSHCKHESPLEHVNITFAIEGVSRITEQQLTRHRLASYSIQSGRYVNRNNLQYVVPKEIEKYSFARLSFVETMEYLQNQYNHLVEILLGEYSYEYLVEETNMYSADLQIEGYTGISHILLNENKAKYKELEKKAIENARYIYPQGLATNIICTMNLREFRHLIDERLCKYAQDEIRDLAKEMLKEVKKIIPFVDYKARKCGVSCFECVGGKNE